MVLNDGKKLENVLSVSTAASNKYLFHFNSFNSLTQWTAGIRLAMYEHTTLQEAYTGALIAGKGKSLNNIRIILDRQRAKHEDWARVRFGAGTPWRRCWCVVEPPDEKEYAKLQKAQKKLSPYNRSQVVLKGSVKFYDTNKIKKKTRPIATVTEAFACYAIYPQSKPLIEQSTLVKIEGRITIHAKPDTVTEGFVFVMPETHPAVSGFEIMLRFLFPVFDTFALYGRPQKLIADVLDTRGLMFAMPPDRRYGYLEMWDVVSLIHAEGSQNWSERQWRKQLKELTSKRMLTAPSRNTSRASRRNRTSMPPSRTVSLRFATGSTQSQPSTRQSSPSRVPDEEGITKLSKHRRTDSAPPASFKTPRHQRSVSEAVGYKKYQSETPSRLAQQIANGDFDTPPPPPEHRQLNGSSQPQDPYDTSDGEPSPDARDLPEVQVAPNAPPSGPVDSPPSFQHAPSQRPPVRPYNPTQAMGPNTQMDSATLNQLADATHQPLLAGIAAAGAAAAWRSSESLQSRRSGDYDRDGQQGRLSVNGRGLSADQYSSPSRSGSRLPTIPASPYVEQPDTFETHAFQPTAPPVPEHRELPTSQRLAELHDSRPGSSENVIYRKPVPGRSSQQPPKGDSDNQSTTSSSLASLRNNVIDPEALDSLENDSSLLRSTSKSSSRYDDDAVSTSTPDYASTVSEEVQPRTLPGRREDRPRSGMLKSIGNRDNVGEDSGSRSRQGNSADIPTIDFGPTYVLTPGTDGANRPGTSGTMTQMLHDNEHSRSKENLAPSPGEQQRLSWLSGRTTPIAATHMRSNSASPNVAQDARTIPWQPGMVSLNPSDNKQKLDPEEWVAKRASAISPLPRGSPVYAHGRSKSHTPPPLSRNHSGDWSQLQRTPEAMPARPPSRPLTSMMQRPSSRGASQLLVDQRPTSLSAREQEQVARVTGTPLLDLHQPDKNKKPQEASEGLTAYIGHREREKAAAKASWNTAAVQAEIDRRMTAAQQRQMLELQQQQMEQMQQMQQQAQLEQLQMERIQMEQQRRSMSPMSMYAQPAYAYSSPDALHLQQAQAQQNQNYFSQPMQSGWGMGVGTPGSQAGMTPFYTPGRMTPQMTPGYAASAYAMSVAPGQSMGQQQGGQQQQRPYTQPYTQPYGASFDQAQAAARFAHQQQQQQQQYRR